MPMMRKREPWAVFFAKSLAVLVIVCAGLGYIHTRYTVGLDTQQVRCLDPYRVFVVDRWDTDPAKGILMAFVSDELEPFYPRGTVVVKQLRGLPGDHVRVTPEATYINGNRVGFGTDKLADKLGRPAESFAREYTLGSGEYFFVGWHEQSYDSRYWGVVAHTQIIGAAKPVL